MNKKQQYKNWRLQSGGDVLWIYFDKQGASTNTIDREVMEEFSSILDAVMNDQNYKGIIIASAKKNGFIAGADIAQFNQFKDIDEAIALLRRGQAILDKLENLTIPTVAMIDGFCLGGGLELALACQYRVAENSAKTRLGLPEVKLGIHPGWGGSVRLPRMIGGINAMDLILTGRTVTGRVAEKLGFVNVVVPRRHLIRAAVYYATEHPRVHHATRWQNFTNTKIMRWLLAGMMRKKLRAKINPAHYPAPFDVLNNWEQVGVVGDETMKKEAKSCGKLFFSETAHNLVRVFFLQERLKGLAKDVRFKAKHVHVIGGGTMGGDIAIWCAYHGMTVTLQDREAKLLAPAMKRGYELFKEKFKENYLVQAAMDRIIPDVEGCGIARADVIIEAIYEDLAAKQAVFKTLEMQAKPDAILATNTSSIPLDEINSVLTEPERLVGIHFFNPVAKMLLVEVVKGEQTDPSIVEKAISFVRALDRLPLPVKSSPGFLVNRILMPYLLASVKLLEKGISAVNIDKAMVAFGMPMGPITLADTVGLDVCLSVAKYLSKYYHNEIPERLVELVKQGKLGRKTGEGFYSYKKGKQIKPVDASDEKLLTDISDPLVACITEESFTCLREGVVADGDLLDAGMVYGTGFAPFRGGPIHYAKSEPRSLGNVDNLALDSGGDSNLDG